MSKAKELLDDENIGNKEVTEPVLTHVMLGMCNVPGEGWSLTSVKYNPTTGETGRVVKEHTGESGDYIAETLKIQMVRKGVFNNCGN